MPQGPERLHPARKAAPPRRLPSGCQCLLLASWAPQTSLVSGNLLELPVEVSPGLGSLSLSPRTPKKGCPSVLGSKLPPTGWREVDHPSCCRHGAEATRGGGHAGLPPGAAPSRGSGPLPAAGRGQGADEQDSSAGAYLPPAGPTTRMSFNLHDKVAPLLRADRMPLGQFPKLFKQCNELNVSAG